MTELAINIAQFPARCSLIYKPVKRFVIKVRPTDGLHCVCPHGADINQIEAFINRQQAWLVKQLPIIHMSDQYQRERDCYPNQLSMTCINQHWSVKYVSAYRCPRLRAEGQQLTVYSNDSVSSIKLLLLDWLRKTAKNHFHKRLTILTKQTGLDYSKLTVGRARSRWGSCSADNDIRLNSMLMFMPSEYVDHVILHELCHTLYHNHSKDFWKLLEGFDPKTKMHDNALKDLQWAYSYIPLFFWA